MEPAKLQTYFLVQMSFIYLWAFCSLYWQIPGLYGDNGLTPARSLLNCKSSNVSECVLFGEKPTLLHLCGSFSLTPMQGMDVLCLFGITLSSLSIIFATFRDSFVYLALWFSYFSCFQVGQTFLWFQWDTLLLETGLLTILVAPFRFLRNRNTRWMPQDNVTLFLVRWLAFRLMFASGIVKLTSECPTWWGLTALKYHYESQCIPTSWAWFAHQMPSWFQSLSVVATYVIEIFLPPLFLLPFKNLRLFAFFSQVFFMVLIIMTGNYNFFNLITITICSAVLVESNDTCLSTNIFKRSFPKLHFLLKWVVIGSIYGTLFYWTTRLFSLRVVGFTVQSKIAFSKAEFNSFLSWTIPKIMLLSCVIFSIEIVSAIFRSVFDFVKHGTFTTLRVIFQCIIVCGVCVIMFAISLVPFSYLDNATHTNVWREVKELHFLSEKYQLTHSYGLFRQMTGVGGRPEVIIEGANDLNGPWKEYEFFYKPGSLNRPLPFVVPHQPRLDWQMWFAALGSYQHNPWFVSLVYKLLKNEGQVLKLMDINPFPKKPPKYIRAQLYHYHFTSVLESDKNYHVKNWWWREFQREYMPPLTLENTGVIDYLKNNGLLIEKPMRPANTSLTVFLRTFRRYGNSYEAPMFIWMVTLAVILVTIVKCKILKV